MNPRRKKRLAIASALTLGTVLIVSLIIYALNSNMNLFYTPHEIIHGKADSGHKPSAGQRIRVGGMVKVGSLKRDEQSLLVQFVIFDSKGGELTISYDDLLPDLFREGQGIVAQGELSEDMTLIADEVLAKHDEEYMPSEVAEAMGKSHSKPEYPSKNYNQ